MCPGIRLAVKAALSFLFCYSSKCTQAQRPDTGAAYQVVAAGSQYNTSPLHQKLWGNHYRKDWNTPVRFKKFYLDTTVGGLTPYQAGGGRQTKTLRLHDSKQREYVLRSIDKDFGRGLPDIYHNTFVEKFLNDQVSIAQPYAALTIPLMAEAAKIYHTWPQIVFLPQQKALDTFNAQFGNGLYLFEQRPDENWEGAENLANSKNIISTEKLFEKVTDNSRHRIDQLLYVRSRLFDILIGDWGRHEDQWRWAAVEQGNITVYKPIPRDRDQAYTKFDGLFIKLAKSAAGAGHLQTFDYKIKDITTFNFPARNLDRRVANETTLQQWTGIAGELQQALTDEVIATSVRQLPPEVFINSGPVLIAKLIQRRDDLVKYATDYYLFLAREVDVTGTNETDYFDVTSLPDGKVIVKVFSADSFNNKNAMPFYTRTFLPQQTKEIRLYGVAGKDNYEVKGDKKRIRIRLIADGAENVRKNDLNTVIKTYDSRNQTLDASTGTRLYSSEDSSTSHSYLYHAFSYDKKGVRPVVFYDGDDRLFAGVHYKALIHRWRKEPFGQRHNFYARYSINQSAFNFGYEGIFNQFAGKWSLLADAYYDLVRWTNFYGLGNDTKLETDDRDFYRIRSKEVWLSARFQRQVGKQSVFTIAPFFRYVQLLKNEDRFLAKAFFNGNGSTLYDGKSFSGAQASFSFQRLNNVLVPTKGIQLSMAVAFTHNLSQPSTFTNYSGNLKFFLPLARHLMLSVENGAATVAGEPEFYQLNTIGGNRLRGHRRDRFWGETIFHNNNELHYLFDVRSHLFNGKLGVLSFIDQGRVWKKQEPSTTWHYGYGGGITIVPFNKIYLSFQYGVSKEAGTFHLELRRSL